LSRQRRDKKLLYISDEIIQSPHPVVLLSSTTSENHINLATPEISTALFMTFIQLQEVKEQHRYIMISVSFRHKNHGLKTNWVKIDM
jgi:hypothetical protein